MLRRTSDNTNSFSAQFLRMTAIALVLFAATRIGRAQTTPLISGGGGFLTSTNGGNTTYLPIIEPLIAAPIGPHVLIESRAALTESFFPRGGGQTGYDHSYFAGLTYLQGDIFLSPH